MGTLIGTYTAAALAVGVYAGWLVIGTRQLSRRLKQLEPHVENARDNTNQPTKLFRGVA
jgi:hypothetical protein